MRALAPFEVQVLDAKNLENDGSFSTEEGKLSTVIERKEKQLSKLVVYCRF